MFHIHYFPIIGWPALPAVKARKQKRTLELGAPAGNSAGHLANLCHDAGIIVNTMIQSKFAMLIQVSLLGLRWDTG
jgi:hypothetical protein